MHSTIRKTAVTIAAVAITALSTTAFAERYGDLDYVNEIDSCIAEFATRVDISNADRVRYVFTRAKRSGSGYALSFSTQVFSAGGEDRYSVYCVSRGGDTPVKFKLKDSSS